MRILLSLAAVAAITLAALAPASATDLGKPRKPTFYAKMSCSNLEKAALKEWNQRGTNGPVNDALLDRRANGDCKGKMVAKYHEPIPQEPVKYVNVCGGSLGFPNLFGKGGSVGMYGGVAATAKHMNDGSSGVDKSTLGFVSPVIGLEACTGLTDHVSLDASTDYMFKGNTFNRSYASGWTEGDRFSLLTVRLGPTWHFNRQWATGVHGLVAWGSLDYTQELNWFGTTYRNEGTSNGTFAGIGASVKYNVTEKVYVGLVYDHGWLVSAVPTGASKTSYDRLMGKVGFTF